MTLLHSITRFVLYLILFLLFQPVVCEAIDPRFELAPGQIKNESIRKVTKGRKGDGRAYVRRSGRSRHNSFSLQKYAADHGSSSSRLQLSSTAVIPANTALGKLQPFWEKVVPATGEALQPLVFKTDTFDLVVDPARYPLLKTADGARLLVDANGTLPPLVRSLIQEKDPSVRVVSESPSDGRRLLGAMLTAGGFYSVEEQPVMTFGTDPQLEVRSDFKVERSAESVMRNEVMLVSASRQGLPVHLTEYLRSQGFESLEPFAEHVTAALPLRHRVVRVATADHVQSVDLVLESLGINAERNHRVALFRAEESGISLSVAADRYFEHGDKRYVVARFTGDPVAYTLFRLLETKGYRVVILNPQDSFKTVSSKLLSSMELPSRYTSHQLVSDPSGRYSIQMSGFLLENASSRGGAVILTDRPLEPSMRTILSDHGYQVHDSPGHP